MIKKTFKIELYSNAKINIIITDDFELAVKKYLKGFEVDISNCTALCTHHKSNPLNIYILLSPNNNEGTIAHESFHATYQILSTIGSELEYHSEECYAYLLGYIVSKITKIKNLYNSKK